MKLFQWAEFSQNPLQSYATGLLAAAMEVPEIASSYREKNAYFVSIIKLCTVINIEIDKLYKSHMKMRFQLLFYFQFRNAYVLLIYKFLFYFLN